MDSPIAQTSMATFSSHTDEMGRLVFSLEGRLDSNGTGNIWKALFKVLTTTSPSPKKVMVDASKVTYCDGSGIGLLLEIKRHQRAGGRTGSIHGLAQEYQHLLELYTVSEFAGTVRRVPLPSNVYVEVGRVSTKLWRGLKSLVRFGGELTSTFFQVIRYPHLLRWKDVFIIVEKAGVNALPIIALVGFLIGLIMSFQSAIPMRQFGAEIFVANLVSLSLLRELGPLVTAIILAGRSGAAFAAEIGTMKVNEEINALTTMGIDPIRFLVVTRVIAAVIVTPLLTMFTNLFGLLGGSVVFTSLGFPSVTFINQIQLTVTFVDLLGGLVKSLVFGMLIAGVGCIHGLKTRSGASAVGDSTTQAVVNILILIVITDGIFSVIYYYLGL